MHQTPDVPGTSPVTDNPNPQNTQGADTTGPGTDTGSGRLTSQARQTGGDNPTPTRPGPEGGGDVRSFRCADVGNADCRWEVSGRTEEELRPQIERHGREVHGIKEFGAGMWTRIKDAIRTRAA